MFSSKSFQDPKERYVSLRSKSRIRFLPLTPFITTSTIYHTPLLIFIHMHILI